MKTDGEQIKRQTRFDPAVCLSPKKITRSAVWGTQRQGVLLCSPKPWYPESLAHGGHK